jgi:hypothetical protein
MGHIVPSTIRVSFSLFGGILRHRYFSRNLFSLYFNGLYISPLKLLNQKSATYQDREN